MLSAAHALRQSAPNPDLLSRRPAEMQRAPSGSKARAARRGSVLYTVSLLNETSLVVRAAASSGLVMRAWHLRPQLQCTAAASSAGTAAVRHWAAR